VRQAKVTKQGGEKAVKDAPERVCIHALARLSLERSVPDDQIAEPNRPILVRSALRPRCGIAFGR